MKQVPVASSNLVIGEAGDTINTAGLAYEANENDLYGIEEAIYQKRILGADVTAISVGPSSARDILYLAYARGANDAVHIVDEKYGGNNFSFNVEAITEFIKTENPAFDLIFTGIRADDDLRGQFGTALAESLGMPMVTSISKLTVNPGAKIANVQREIGEGYIQEIEVDMPCLLTIQFGIRPLQYTSVIQLIKAKSKKVRQTTFDKPVDESELSGPVTVLSQPALSKGCEMIEGSPSEIVQKLVQNLTLRK